MNRINTTSLCLPQAQRAARRNGINHRPRAGHAQAAGLAVKG